MTKCRSCNEDFIPSFGECEACGGDGEMMTPYRTPYREGWSAEDTISEYIGYRNGAVHLTSDDLHEVTEIAARIEDLKRQQDSA